MRRPMSRVDLFLPTIVTTASQRINRKGIFFLVKISYYTQKYSKIMRNTFAAQRTKCSKRIEQNKVISSCYSNVIFIHIHIIIYVCRLPDGVFKKEVHSKIFSFKIKLEGFFIKSYAHFIKLN